MYAYFDDLPNRIHIDVEDGDGFVTILDVWDAIFNSIDFEVCGYDGMELGEPLFYGNDYATFPFVVSRDLCDIVYELDPESIFKLENGVSVTLVGSFI